MAATAVFHGTQTEGYDLVNAISRNCACQFDKVGARVATCPPHDAMVHSQRFLDHLLFLRRIRVQLDDEEWLRERPMP